MSEEKRPRDLKIVRPQPPAQPGIEDRFKKLIAESSPLIRDLAGEITSQAIRPYPHWGLASALAIVSGVAQGSFKTPTGAPLSLYQWIIGPAACGKDAYNRPVGKYLSSVHAGLLSYDPGSSYGLRSSLLRWNSCVTVKDEVHDFFEKTSRANNVHMNQINTDIKELFNGLDVLAKVALKGGGFPAIESPVYGIFGMGTPEGFNRCISKDFISSGILSRFTIWPFTSLGTRNDSRDSEFHINKRLLEDLKFIFADGVTSFGDEYDMKRSESAIAGSSDQDSKYVHQAQMKPRLMTMSPEAKILMTATWDTYDHLYRERAATSESDPSLSVIGRTTLSALKFASLNAIAKSHLVKIENRIVVDASDMTWGCQLAELLNEILNTHIASEYAETEWERKKNRIMNILRKKTSDLNEMLSWREFLPLTHLRAKEAMDIVIELGMTGQLVVYDPVVGYDKPMRAPDFEIDKKLPRGCFLKVAAF